MDTGKSVLLIDDDQDIALGTSLRLRALGYRTAMASDGRDGLEQARTLGHQAILLDVRMPDMNGLQVLDELQADSRTRRIPVVMLSASLVDCQAALDAGAKFFISKPYDWPQLSAALEKVTDNRSHD